MTEDKALHDLRSLSDFPDMNDDGQFQRKDSQPEMEEQPDQMSNSIKPALDVSGSVD